MATRRRGKREGEEEGEEKGEEGRRERGRGEGGREKGKKEGVAGHHSTKQRPPTLTPGRACVLEPCLLRFVLDGLFGHYFPHV